MREKSVQTNGVLISCKHVAPMVYPVIKEWCERKHSLTVLMFPRVGQPHRIRTINVLFMMCSNQG